MDYSQIAIIFSSLIFSALFSGIEIAFVKSDKLQIELKAQQGDFSAKILSRFIGKPSTFISTTLVGNNIALVLYGIYMANILEPVIARELPEIINTEIIVLLIQTIIATLIVLVTAEFTPKSIFLLNPNWMLTIFAPLILIIYYILYPIVYLILKLSRFLINKLLRLKYSDEQPVFGLTDLNNYIENLKVQSEQNSIDLNTKIFNNALEFKTVKVRECMIPRTEVVAVDINDEIDELKEALIGSGHSKILIYKNSIDEVIGYCHSLELFKKPKDIQSILNPIIIVPETMHANELMIQFITERKSVALVVDEFGGTSGIITMEDIIEEIFGEIQDEHDDEDWTEQKVDESTWLVSARHEIDYLNEKYHWEIPEGDYDTLGGFILSINENIPSINDVVKFGNMIFTVISMQDTRIDIVKVKIIHKQKNSKS